MSFKNSKVAIIGVGNVGLMSIRKKLLVKR